MKLVYTNHARERMKRRDVEDWEVEHILNFPSFVLKSFENRKIAIGKVRNRRIKIVFVEEESYKKVITVA